MLLFFILQQGATPVEPAEAFGGDDISFNHGKPLYIGSTVSIGGA